MPISDIKSSYFILKLFSHLDEEMKLKIVKYNKNYQYLLNIKLINYKIFSGRYIEYESNGKGKEYNIYGVLVYEGKYLNGKRNGKGKEYNMDGNLKFEGEYLNDKKWNGKLYTFELSNGVGIGNELYNIRESLFQGNYINGERNGRGKEYYSNGELKYYYIIKLI